MDRIDRRILECIQEDSTLSVADIADKVGLSSTPCWRRIQKLEKTGVIRKRVALLDRNRLNLGVDVLSPSKPVSTAPNGLILFRKRWMTFRKWSSFIG